MKIKSDEDAIAIIKGNLPFVDCSPEEVRRAWQYLVNSGRVWSLDKWWSDMAMCLISSGAVRRMEA